jgi:endogenous inhibitor of DNA gyrase (YacG/DUF329 family)
MTTGKTAHCKQCGKPFKAKTARSLYCSGACRAKASRAAHGAIVDNPALASERRNQTKGEQTYQRQCAQCGEAFTINGRQLKRIYCSNRCKKLAFQARE